MRPTRGIIWSKAFHLLQIVALVEALMNKNAVPQHRHRSSLQQKLRAMTIAHPTNIHSQEQSTCLWSTAAAETTEDSNLEVSLTEKIEESLETAEDANLEESLSDEEFSSKYSSRDLDPDELLQRTEQWIELHEERKDDGNSDTSRKTTNEGFELIISWARLKTVDGAEQAGRILGNLEASPSTHSYLTRKHYTSVMDAWGKVGALHKSRDILRRMQQHGDPSVAPDQISLQVFLSAWARHAAATKTSEEDVQDDDNASRLWEDLLNPGQHSSAGNTEFQLKPSTFDYNVVLGLLANEGKAWEAEALVKAMVDRCRAAEESNQDGEEVAAPNLLTYNLLLDAHAKSAHPSAANRALSILNHLQAHHFAPNVSTYTKVLSAMTRVVEAQAAIPNKYQRTEDVLTEGDIGDLASQLQKDCLAQGLQPDRSLYLSLMNAYSLSSKPQAVDEAEKILESLEEAGQANQIAYNTLLKALKKNPSSSSSATLERAESILHRMEERHLADRYSYTSVMGTLAAQGTRQASRRAHDLLRHMTEQYMAGNEEAKPNCISYNHLLHAYSQCRLPDEAEKVLQDMEAQANQDPVGVAPNVFSYATVMNGYARLGTAESLKITEDLFERVKSRYEAGDEQCRPNLVCFTTLINACAKTGTADGAAKAEETLHKLYDIYRETGDEGLKPNVQLFSWTIDCWQRSGLRDAGERAEILLDWMLGIYDETGDEDFKLNGYAFSSAISAWAKSRRMGKAQRALSLLHRMSKLYEEGFIDSQPDTFHYTNVIHCCAYCENDDFEKKRSLQIAIETYRALLASKTSEANNVTFMGMLTVLRNLLPPGKQRTAALHAVFQDAAKEGQVDANLLRRLNSAQTLDEMREIFPDGAVTTKGHIRLEALPEEWRRKIRA